MKKILITTSSFNLKTQPHSVAQLEKYGYQIDTNPHGRKLTKSEVIELLAGVTGMIAGVEPLTRDVLEQAKHLKVISRCGIGMDSVDLVAAKELGIKVYNTPSAPVAAVAELTLGLMLSLLRKVAISDSKIRQSQWQPLMGNLLSAQTVGIVGFGQIGQKVASLLNAFGSKILICDPYVAEISSDKRFVSMDCLLSESNLVTLHLPGSSENYHLFDASKLDAMKQGSFLINTARGGLVDEAALHQKLVSGHLAGAALDVFEQEPYNGPLSALPTMLLTSHMGSYARESRTHMESEAMINLLKGLQLETIGLNQELIHEK